MRARLTTALAAALALWGCPKRLPVPPALAEARRLVRASRLDVAALGLAFQRYQEIAQAAPEGPLAGEAAYALGILALDLHLLSLAPFAHVPGLHARLGKVLAGRRVPVGALPAFAVRVFTVARDRWTGIERDRAERAMDLAGVRARMLDLLAELQQGRPAKGPVQRFATLLALEDTENQFVRTAAFPELVERTVLLQRATLIHLATHLDEKAGCAVTAYLAKSLLRKDLDAERPLPACLAQIDTSDAVARARLLRAAWVRLEEFGLDRPHSPFAPVVQALLQVAPPEAKRPAK
jgi:hypothetical protein